MRPISSYRPPQRARDLPLPPRWQPPAPRLDYSRLTQFVFLSMLLHALAIMLFGAPSGGSREGRAMWGSLVVRLTPAIDPGPALKLDRTPVHLPTAHAPAPRPEPAVPERARTRAEPRKPPPAPAPEPMPPAPAAQAPAPPFVFPPLLDRLTPADRALPMSPVLRVPPPTEVQKPPAPERLAAPVEIPAALPASPEPARTEASLVETPALAVMPVAPPMTPPVAIAPVEVPTLPAPLTEATVVPRTELAPAPEIVRAGPLPVAPVRAEAAAAPPTPVLAEPARATRPDPPASRTESIETPATARAQGPRSSPFKSAAPSGDAFDPTRPALDPEALRSRASQIAREGAGRRAIFAFPMPPVPARKSKLETALENARKPDCRTAYQQLGLVAIVPLIANEFGEGSCRW